MADGHIPFVHYEWGLKKIKGKPYYQAEINDSAGPHRILLDKKKVDNGEIRIRN